jgi:hypothetical protein
MKDATNSLRRQLVQLAKRVKQPAPSFLGSPRFWRFICGNLAYQHLSEEEQTELAAGNQRIERDYDPPDAIERHFGRMLAGIRDECLPDADLSLAERRQRDWADYHAKEKSRKEEEQQDSLPQYGLRELLAPETMNADDSEQSEGKE